jgi:ABC-type methionine transport system ATPase subunit
MIMIQSSRQDTENLSSDRRLVQRRIRIQIPPNYHQDPIISTLVSQYGLAVNIIAALLDTQGKGSGWFDLQLQGNQAQIKDALIYLSDLNVELWAEDAENDGW